MNANTIKRAIESKGVGRTLDIIVAGFVQAARNESDDFDIADIQRKVAVAINGVRDDYLKDIRELDRVRNG